MNAGILTIGDEILIGQIQDTNSTWISSNLNELGIRVIERISVGDNSNTIKSAIERMFSRTELVIVTGGLGPTRDDITKATLCDFFETELELNEELLNRLTAYFIARGRTINESNKTQAMIPKACRILPNERGTAQGMWFEKNGKVLVSMPGVPHEMKAMFSNSLKDMLREKFAISGIYHKNIMTVGMGESFIADKIAAIENALPAYISLAYLPSLGKVRLRLSAYGRDYISLKEETDIFAEQIAQRLGDIVYGFDELSLEQHIGNLLLDMKLKLGTAESCSGGSIASLITSVSGSSAYYEGSVVSYSYDVKKTLLGVQENTLKKYGAVSEECVQEMAQGLLKILPIDVAIAVSGIAGPAGGTPDKPVGTVWMAVSDKDRTYSRKYQFTQNRSDNIALTGVNALNLLRLFILGLV